MHNELDDLKNMWQNARETAPQPSANVAAIIQQANQKKGKSLRVQWANVIILLLATSRICKTFKSSRTVIEKQLDSVCFNSRDSFKDSFTGITSTFNKFLHN